MILPDGFHALSAQLCCRACQSFALRCPDCGTRHSWDWRKDPQAAAILLSGRMVGLTAVACRCGAQLVVSVAPGTRLSPQRCRLERSYSKPPGRGFDQRREPQRRNPEPSTPARCARPCPDGAERLRVADWAAEGVGGIGVSGCAIAAAYRRLFDREPPRDPQGRSHRVYSRRELLLCMAAAGYETAQTGEVQP